MAVAPRQLKLNAFVYPAGHHEAAWRHPDSRPERVFEAAYHREIAQRAEAAKLDAIFLADSPSLMGDVAHHPSGGLEPLTLLSNIAAATTHIGLIATASTTYAEPYNLARWFASLDHLSDGRAGWNIVTTRSTAAAANFGLPAHPDHDERYERAGEFVDAVVALWDSWEDDAIVLDRAAGAYADADKVHTVDFVGRHFQVRGPFNVARAPQGRPVLVQAGASNQGRGFAARYAEAIFTAHQRLEDARAFALDVRDRAARLGRDPDGIVVMPGISPFIGSTEAEARALERECNELTVTAYGLASLQQFTGRSLADHPLDERLPVDIFGAAGDVTDNTDGRRQVIVGIVERERPTLRQLLHRLAGARGHRVVAGTPEQIAATMTEWFEAGAADGFNVMPPVYPAGLETFVDTVVPILQERGLFRTEYTGTTLRDHLGLERPESTYAASRRTAVAAR